jgi:ABC-2 type transport system permease protein
VLGAYIAGERLLPDGARLDAAAVLRREPGAQLGVDLWNANLSDPEIEGAVRDVVGEELRRERLAAAGVGPDVLRQVDALAPQIRVLSPRAESGGEVSLRDRLPAIVGFSLGLVLWSAVLSGAGILLNSVMEEKSGRVLEILAASATTFELMGGKILGVAALAATLLGAWAALGTMALVNTAPGLAADLRAVLLTQNFLLYFGLYAVLGYVMYAAVFAGIGAFCETPRDSQALLGPVMLFLTVPIFFMGLALRDPEAPLLRILSWIPPFTPFIMLPRAAGEVPWWEIAGTLLLMSLVTVAVVQLSGRAFHAGALATGRPDPKAWLARRLWLRAR